VSARIGTWSQTYTGRMYWPQDPRPEDVHPADIAHALSLQCRFAGHCRWHYSVAQHSLLVAELAGGDGAALWGLLHDAAEAYCVDLPRPIKNHSAMGFEYKKIEALNMAAIRARFGLVGEQPAIVYRADEIALATEFRDLMSAPPDSLELEEAPARERIARMSPEIVESHFLQALRLLVGAKLFSITDETWIGWSEPVRVR
jgi:hypothetical protein